MCEVCDGKKPIPELSGGYYCPGPIWIGVKNKDDFTRGSITEQIGDGADWEMMVEHKANVFVPGSEMSACYRFKFCPECGRNLAEEDPQNAKEGVC